MFPFPMRGWKTGVRAAHDLAARVPVPHEGLEGEDPQVTAQLGAGFPFPMRGWKSDRHDRFGQAGDGSRSP